MPAPARATARDEAQYGDPRLASGLATDTSAPTRGADIRAVAPEDILFLYGEYDPWSGGAYDIADSNSVVSLTAPLANHGAMLRGLAQDDRDRALDLVAGWVGRRPPLEPAWRPSGDPRVPGLGANEQSFVNLDRLNELRLSSDDAAERVLR